MGTYKSKSTAKAYEKKGKDAPPVMTADSDNPTPRPAGPTARTPTKKSTFMPKTLSAEDVASETDELKKKIKALRLAAPQEEKFKTLPLKPGEEGKVEPIGTHDPSEKPVYTKL